MGEIELEHLEVSASYRQSRESKRKLGEKSGSMQPETSMRGKPVYSKNDVEEK